MGQVNDPVIAKRTSIVDPHDHAAAVVQVGDTHPRSKWKGAVSCSERSFAQSLTTRGCAPVEAGSVPTCSSADHLHQL